jgi:hypothetical protein
MILQNKITTSIHTLHKIKSVRLLQNKIVTSIHYNLFIHETMYLSVQSTYIAIYSIKRRFWRIDLDVPAAEVTMHVW